MGRELRSERSSVELCLISALVGKLSTFRRLRPPPNLRPRHECPARPRCICIHPSQHTTPLIDCQQELKERKKGMKPASNEFASLSGTLPDLRLITQDRRLYELIIIRALPCLCCCIHSANLGCRSCRHNRILNFMRTSDLFSSPSRSRSVPARDFSFISVRIGTRVC